MSLYSKLFQYVLRICAKYNIDESHGVSHAMNIFMYSNQIYEHEVVQHPFLKQQECVIYASAILHDMCDKKYMDQDQGVAEIEEFLKNCCNSDSIEHAILDAESISAIKCIITTMSYSHVKVHGFPSLGKYQHAYHIVREADLFCAYDFDRCMIYHMNKVGVGDIQNAFNDSVRLFETRVFLHHDHNLLVTDYSKCAYIPMHENSIARINHWRKMLQ